MDRFEKRLLFVFAVLSLITLISNLFNYENVYGLFFVLVVLIFNFCFYFLIIFARNKMQKIMGGDLLLFALFFVLSFFVYWYFLSSFFNIYYGSFITIGGLYFFMNTQSVLTDVIVLSVSFIFVLGISVWFFYNHKKDFEKSKTKRKRYVLLVFLLLIILMFFVPRVYLKKTNPYIDFLKGLTKPGYIDISKGTLIRDGEEILNISVDEKMNVVFLLLDSVYQGHVGYYGYERPVTPNIDRLAEEGIVFHNAHSHASHTNHAVPTFLSARYTLSGNYQNVYDEDYPRDFIWDILKKEGYKTGFFSSQDENWGNIVGYYNKENLDVFSHSWTDGKVDYGGAGGGDYDGRTRDDAIEWVKGLDNESFFLYVNLQAPHYPYSYPEGNSLFLPDETSIFTNYLYLAEDDFEATINKYDNALRYADSVIGELVDYLEDNGMENNTLIVVGADHGEVFNKRHGNFRHGFGVYEDELNVPLIFYIPGKEHEDIWENVQLIDVVPTVLDFFNFSSSEHFQGDVMKKDPYIFLYTQNQISKIGVINRDIKYVLDLDRRVTEVYNLSSDPGEEKNLVKDSWDEKYYAEEYGYVLFNWYNCQIDYYSGKLWEEGELIDC